MLRVDYCDDIYLEGTLSQIVGINLVLILCQKRVDFDIFCLSIFLDFMKRKLVLI